MKRQSYSDMIINQDKYTIFTDIENLDIYCEYVLNDSSKYITHSNLLNLYDYIEKMDENVFTNSDTKMARYLFLKYYLEAKVVKGMVKRSLCANYALENIDKRYHMIIRREIINAIDADTMNEADIKFVNQKVFAELNYVFMRKYMPAMMRVMQDIEDNQITDRADELSPLFQSILTEITTAKRRSIKSNSFNLTDKTELYNVITETVERTKNSSNFLKTGYYAFNRLLNGGFENSRLYNIVGGTGGFKSGFLLNLMKCVKLYNKKSGRRGKKKRRTILFVSQENNIFETIERIFNIFSVTERMSNYTAEEVIKLLDEGGFSIVADDQDIDIEFRYYGNEDVGVPDLKGMVEELENAGKEVIIIFQDYIERLRPPKRNVDRRIQLADVSNQLHDLAIELDIPIVTASQFNREGNAIVEAMSTGESKIARPGAKVPSTASGLGSKDISESFGMLKNIDVNILISPFYKEGKWWLFIKKIKFRGSDDNFISEFYQPFEGVDSKIMLVCDVDGKPAYRETLFTEAEIQSVSQLKASVTERKRLIAQPKVLDISKSKVDAITKEFVSLNVSQPIGFTAKGKKRFDNSIKVTDKWHKCYG